MKAGTLSKATLFLSGWAVAGWLWWGNRQPATQPPAALPGPVGDEVGAAKDDRIAGHFARWSADPALAGASLAFCLLDENGEVVFASDLSDRALCPASALKTLTTATALEQLGPDFCFVTRLGGEAASFSDGVLDGDLVLEASHDPTLATPDLRKLAEDWLEAGLKQVNGRVLVRSGITAAPVNDHWNWGDIGNAYGVGAWPLNVDHNRLTISFRPGAEPGSPAALAKRPETGGDTVWVNEVATGPAGSGDQVSVYSEPAGRTISMRGTVPMGESVFSVGAALPNPPARAVAIVTARLREGGVRFKDRPSAAAKKAVPFAAVHESAPLPEIIDHLHRVSDNLEAQCLFLTLGHRAGTSPATAVIRHWESRGVEFRGLRLIDGSGLARANMIRPLDLAAVNFQARRGPSGDRFRESLSAYVDGKVRSKLGSMSGVKTDAGFITLPGGREFTFALMANGLDPSLDFWPRRHELLRQVASGR